MNQEIEDKKIKTKFSKYLPAKEIQKKSWRCLCIAELAPFSEAPMKSLLPD